jgi:hypothetical protein
MNSNCQCRKVILIAEDTGDTEVWHNNLLRWVDRYRLSRMCNKIRFILIFVRIFELLCWACWRMARQSPKTD